MTSTSLLERISPGQYQEPQPPLSPLNPLRLLSIPSPHLLESSTIVLLLGLRTAEKAIPLTLTQRGKESGQRSATGH